MSDRYVLHASGFTLVELMVTIAIISIIGILAVPAFSTMINREKVGAASDGLIRAVQQAKAHAIQTGKRTELIINGSTISNCVDSAGTAQDVAWVIRDEGVTDKAIQCLTKSDFNRRFRGSTLSPSSEQSIIFTPLGIANNNIKLTYTTGSKDRNKTVEIYPGGAIVPKVCTIADGTTNAKQDC